ncbi:MAG: hypothetical protein IH825_03765 [Candidatus Marinimicrobia bacterium]|nr:hypothetical protein [Candidatus Neomarinimicrobiota bacterium]
MTYQEIVIGMSKNINDSNYAYNQLYAGITSDIDSRLHGDHNVSKEDDWYSYALADSEEIARQVESYFIGLGMDGETDDDDSSSKYVYTFHKTSTTNPSIREYI